MTDPQPTPSSPSEAAQLGEPHEVAGARPADAPNPHQPVSDPDDDGGREVAHGELVASDDDDGGEDETDPARREAVEEPAKVMRIGSMIKQLLEEVRSAALDGPARQRLTEIYDTSVQELGAALSPDLREELDRMTNPFGDAAEPSDAELRVAQAQLVGWLEGLFHGIQATLFTQQMAAQQQLEEMRHQLGPGGGPNGAAAGPAGPGGPGPGGPMGPDGGENRPGTYL